MTTQHTKEQWRLDFGLCAVFVIKDHKLQHVADFGKSLLLETDENMRLCAAAPELLSALQECVRQCADYERMTDDCALAFRNARSAIEKATMP